MSIFQAASLVAVLVAGVATADYIRLFEPVGVVDETQGYITREWRWSEDGTSWTVFTAYGPLDQVNAFDPRTDDSPLRCPDCQLASSIQAGPEDTAGVAGRS